MGRLFPVTFCVMDSMGCWHRDTPLWKEELPFIPAVGSHIRLQIKYDEASDKGFPEREQSLPDMAKRTYEVKDVLQEVSAKYKGFTGRRETEVAIFIAVRETNPLEQKPY